MKDFTGKAAFVTGGANGIGLSIARSLARAGANVALGDIEEKALENAREQVAQFGTQVISVPTDVSDQAAVMNAADTVESAFGNIHLLFNNAGVQLSPLPVTNIETSQWEWLFGVNIFGVINGVSTFVPRMLAHGEGGHVINTASDLGLQVSPGRRNASYVMTKAAVIALSQHLEYELEGKGIGVSVFCPGPITTTLGGSARRRPARFGGPFEGESTTAANVPDRIGAENVGDRVLQAISEEDFFIFTHDRRAWLEKGNDRLIAGFDSFDRYAATQPG